MNKKRTKVITLFSLLTVLIAFFISPITSFAATVNYEKVANYISTWHIQSLGGLHWTDEGIHMIKADNQPAFCIEHGTLLTGGSGFTPSELTIAEKERLSLIAYYGYQINPTVDNYGITQNMIWLEFGDELLTTNIPNFKNRRNEILNQVKNHNIKPTFNNQTINLKVGESVTLEDKNNVLSKYVKQLSNSANLKIEKNSNKLTLTATKDSKESGTIKYGIADSNSVGQSFVYAKPNEQKVATFKLSNAGEFNLNVKVKLNGNIKVKKIDKDTGKPLPNAKLKFEYDNQTKEMVTDSNGLAQINDITQGTTVTISEVTAPDGFFNQGELKKVIVEPNKTIDVTLDNKPQKGQLSLIKKGKVPVGLEKKETEYGDLYVSEIKLHLKQLDSCIIIQESFFTIPYF
ncbi:TPA: SpaA isopeptide-forming pilin-related protein [Listeria monocytogenes]